MKTSKINFGLFILITLAAINCFAINAAAQRSGCSPRVNSIYFTDAGLDGPPLKAVHPGKGYDLHINGYDAIHFDVAHPRFMAVLSLKVAAIDSPTWHVEFAPNMARDIPSIQMRNNCPPPAGGRTTSYNLDANVRLFNQ